MRKYDCAIQRPRIRNKAYSYKVTLDIFATGYCLIIENVILYFLSILCQRFKDAK